MPNFWLAFRVRLLEMFGVIIGHHKRQHMSTTPRFLGLITDFSLASTNYTVSLQCCPTTKTRAMQMLSELLSTCKVTSGQAAKARGLLNWLEMSMLGRPLTAAFSGFIARQYFDTTESLTPELALCLQYLQLALSILPSRIVEIYQNPRPPVIIYTDASTEAPTALAFASAFRLLGMTKSWFHPLYLSLPSLHQPSCRIELCYRFWTTKQLGAPSFDPPRLRPMSITCHG